MSWSEIKKALNSTLGTKNFRPLNEFVINSKTVVASDNVLRIIDGGYNPSGSISKSEVASGTTRKTFEKECEVSFEALVNGDFKLVTTLSAGTYQSTTNTVVSLLIYKNESLLETISTSRDVATVNINKIYSCKYGDKFEFKIKVVGKRTSTEDGWGNKYDIDGSCDAINLCGDVVDKVFEYTYK